MQYAWNVFTYIYMLYYLIDLINVMQYLNYEETC